MLKELKKELREKQKLEHTTRMEVRTLELVFVKDNPVCNKCSNTKNLSYDHIVPQSILRNFNIDADREFWEKNGQTLCSACNNLKANNLDLTNPKTKELLLELIKE